MRKIDAKGMKKINPKKGIIVSYPRSGLNWVRYCIEYFSGLRTPGPKKIHEKGKLALYRTHDVKRFGPKGSCFCAFYDPKGKPLHNKVLLLLRDYHEAYLRQSNHKTRPMPTAEEIRQGKRVFKFRNYFENLRAYDKFSGKKTIVYYRDLIEDFSEITKILDFFGFTYDLTDFDLEYHRQKSIQIYDNQHKSYSKDDLYNFTFHRDRVASEVNKALDEFVDANYKDLADRYLR
ncbi:MAG: hypothetical protein AAGA60_12285 [Cyanobacteria bacterium P01_E01_bin.42]